MIELESPSTTLTLVPRKESTGVVRVERRDGEEVIAADHFLIYDHLPGFVMFVKGEDQVVKCINTNDILSITLGDLVDNS